MGQTEKFKKSFYSDESMCVALHCWRCACWPPPWKCCVSLLAAGCPRSRAIREFLDSSECRLLVVYSDNVTVAHTFPKNLARTKAVYFLKPESVVLRAETMGATVMCGEMTRRTLAMLEQVLQNVYRPLLSNPGNQVSPRLIIATFNGSLQTHTDLCAAAVPGRLGRGGSKGSGGQAARILGKHVDHAGADRGLTALRARRALLARRALCAASRNLTPAVRVHTHRGALACHCLPLISGHSARRTRRRLPLRWLLLAHLAPPAPLLRPGPPLRRMPR